MLLYRNTYQKTVVPGKYPTVTRLDKPKESPIDPEPPTTEKTKNC